MIKEKIHKAIQKVSGASDFNVESSQYSEQGDYSTNVSMVQAKAEKKNPRELAEELVQKLSRDKSLAEIVEKVEVAGPGFINFFIKKEYLIKEMQSVLSMGGEYGKSDAGKGKKVIVEYSSPNIAKPFTVGHFRSTIIGDAVANLLKATGWEVMRDNHIGDWGTQFGKQIYAIKELGDGYQKNIEKIESSQNPVKELVSLYVRFHEEAEKDESLNDKAREWFRKLENGDSEARDLWRKCIEWSWKEFNQIYEVLGVKFDEEFDNGRGLGESFFEDKMGVVIDELKENEMLTDGMGGAKLVFFEDEKYSPAMILKSDGATLYHTRDLATDKYRKDKFDPDIIINEVGSEQTLYFRQLFEIEKLLGWYEDGQRVHIKHGLIRIKEGKMSTRKGNVIWLQDVLGESIEKARKLGSDSDNLAQMVGIGALKYNDLKRDSETAITFDWDEVLNMQGNSGPYLQYTVARAKSVLHKAKFTISNYRLSINDQLFNELNEEELLLLRAFPKFPEVIQIAAENYSPNLLCNYLYDLAQKYNSFYNKHKIIGEDNEESRLALTAATGIVLENGLKLLGIQVPERM